MPFSISIHSRYNLIWKSIFGDISLADIQSMNKSAEVVHCAALGFGVIDDMRGLRSIDVNFPRMSLVQVQLRGIYSNTRHLPYAIHAPDDLSYGMGRMLMATLVDFHPLRLGVFRTLEETARFQKLPTEALEMLRADQIAA